MRDSPSRRQCACAVAGSLHLCFPSHCRPEGAPGQAGPCSPAPVPVGFVSIRRRHPGCTLHAALRTSLRRLEAAGALGVAGRLGADPPSRRSCRWVAAGTAPTSGCGGGRGLSPAASPAPSTYQPQVRCSGARGTVAGRLAVRVRLRAPVSWPGPLPSAVRVPGRKKRLPWWKRCGKPAPFLVTLLHSFGHQRALPPMRVPTSGSTADLSFT